MNPPLFSAEVIRAGSTSLLTSTGQHKSHRTGRGVRLTAAACYGSSWRAPVSLPRGLYCYQCSDIKMGFRGSQFWEDLPSNCLSVLEGFLWPKVLLELCHFPFHHRDFMAIYLIVLYLTFRRCSWLRNATLANPTHELDC